MPKTAISNSDDIIDSRDVIARIEEFEGERGNLVCDVDFHAGKLAEERNEETEQAYADAQSALEDWDSDNSDELASLKEITEQVNCEDGEALIRDSYFQEYAEELADDIGAIDRNANWPVNCIDWEKAADQLKMDYTSVDLNGVEYWIRS